MGKDIRWKFLLRIGLLVSVFSFISITHGCSGGEEDETIHKPTPYSDNQSHNASDSAFPASESKAKIVSCGSRKAVFCNECSKDKGKGQCNGDCRWTEVTSTCIDKNNCENSNKNCVFWASLGYCDGKYGKWVTENCKKACSNDCSGGNGDTGDTKDDYCNEKIYGKDHTMCKYADGKASTCGNVMSRGITDQSIKDSIVKKHNELRSKVANGDETNGVGGGQPTASNMRSMVWSDELAKIAQRWTDQCNFGHDANRRTKKHDSVGQNAWKGWSTQNKPGAPNAKDLSKAVQGWYDEVKDFPPGNVGAFSKAGATGMIGHYTQVVWAKSYEVGCGYIHYPDGSWNAEMFICNYGPGGNWLGAPVYDVGVPGSECPSGTSKDELGLCG